MGKVAVLGTGPSIELFGKTDIEFDATIGVNDIWKYFETDVIVCVDKRKAFTPDRLRIIDSSKPKAFYSQIVSDWDTRPDFIKINIQAGYPDHTVVLDRNAMAKSYFSPFVAIQIAYWYYDTDEIHLYGVDMDRHPNLDRELCKGIKKHFKNVCTALEISGCRLIVHGDGILTK